jgi:hypothetical protein
LVSAGETQGAIRKNPLRVGNVPEHFFYGPLVRRVPEIPIALTSAREKSRGLFELGLQRLENVIARYE